MHGTCAPRRFLALISSIWVSASWLARFRCQTFLRDRCFVGRSPPPPELTAQLSKALESGSLGILRFPDTIKNHCEYKELSGSQPAMSSANVPHFFCTAQEAHRKETFKEANNVCRDCQISRWEIKRSNSLRWTR